MIPYKATLIIALSIIGHHHLRAQLEILTQLNIIAEVPQPQRDINHFVHKTLLMRIRIRYHNIPIVLVL